MNILLSVEFYLVKNSFKF
ncbi:hypothetical protein DNTS_034389 [Danionella cerebrum]|uniref:Uncharacterized protein n=1 Tax=Danionella cerebrum TaxID=2873325 RepID=A0A553Q190_9TELE|nr:hypothetical protein DNTS_034389 [Danionella translucida]